MSVKKKNALLSLGLLSLSLGLILHLFVHARFSEFVAGLLIGMALVFIIAGFIRRKRSEA